VISRTFVLQKAKERYSETNDLLQKFRAADLALEETAEDVRDSLAGFPKTLTAMLTAKPSDIGGCSSNAADVNRRIS
jgi:hypothetical protein